jgi:hypothetical protein
MACWARSPFERMAHDPRDVITSGCVGTLARVPSRMDGAFPNRLERMAQLPGQKKPRARRGKPLLREETVGARARHFAVCFRGPDRAGVCARCVLVRVSTLLLNLIVAETFAGHPGEASHSHASPHQAILREAGVALYSSFGIGRKV